MSAILLDTCAMIYLAENAALEQGAAAEIRRAGQGDGIFVSPVSAWEMALLCAKGRFSQAATSAEVERWYDAFVSRPGIHLASFTGAIALDSVSLPELPHRDPVDRFLIATARSMKVPLVTRDRVILNYAASGHVRCIPC